MIGFEIVGVILGVIPLIIEGIDRSQTAFAVFAVYHHYAKELSKLDSKLGVQRTVFRNNCINLLLHSPFDFGDPAFFKIYELIVLVN
jgi:hypothetical protein